MIFDVNFFRSQFPILSEKIYGKQLVYLDNGATTQKPHSVLEKIMDVYERYNSNVHRGVHHLSNITTDLHENARKRVAEHINAISDREVVFTRGTTESINLMAYSFGETYCHEGDEIIVSAMEHHANLVPWQLLCERKKMKLRIAPIDANGCLILPELYKLFNERTKLLSITHVSNVTGIVNPIEEIVNEAHAHHVPVLIDAAQSMPHMIVDVQAIDCDFMAFSGHKMYAPNGIGVLYGRRRFLDEMVPYQSGGAMIDKVTLEKTTFLPAPLRFEAGTPDYVGAIGLAAAIDYIDNIGKESIRDHEKHLTEYALEGLRSIDGVRIIGESENRSSVVSFLVGDAHPYDTGMILDKMGIAVRTGHHCAQPLMTHFGITGTVRASFAIYNTTNDVDALIDGVKRVKTMLCK